MAAISDKALKGWYPENKYRFQKQELQNKEFSDGSGLEMYQFKYRMDDPQIGRFWQIDPLADKYVYNSTYAFSENKVTGHVELEGLEAIEARIERDLNDVQSGKITKEQLSSRLEVRGKSDLIAAGLGILANLFGPEETVGLGRFILRTAESAPEQEAKTPQSAPKSDELPKVEEGSAKPRNAPARTGTPNSSKIDAKDNTGKTTKYTTYDENGKWVKQVEADRGTPRHGIPGATKKVPTQNTLPDGTIKPGKPEIKPAEPWEIPPGTNH